MKDLIELATKAHNADHEYETAFRRFWTQAPPMEMADFWAMAKVLLETISKRLGQSQPGSDENVNYEAGLKLFVWNKFFKERTEADLPADPVATAQKLASFIRTYRTVCDRYYEAIWSMDGLERGDDSYGDLVDQLPMVGPELYDEVMSGKIEDYYDFSRKILNLTGTGMCRAILHGEKYIKQTIMEETQKYLKASCHGEG